MPAKKVIMSPHEIVTDMKMVEGMLPARSYMWVEVALESGRREGDPGCWERELPTLECNPQMERSQTKWCRDILRRLGQVADRREAGNYPRAYALGKLRLAIVHVADELRRDGRSNDYIAAVLAPSIAAHHRMFFEDQTTPAVSVALA